MAGPITNQQAFLNGMDQIIQILINGTQPSSDPAKTAWAWFKATGGLQPGEVNLFMSNSINDQTLSDAQFQNVGNSGAWLTAMDTNFAAATGDVKTWLMQNYVLIPGSAPTIPPLVIDWTREHLPSGIYINNTQR